MKVNITATQRVRYYQTVEMTEEQYAEWEGLINARDSEVAEFIEPFIDLRDVFDADQIEDVDVRKALDPKEKKNDNQAKSR